MDVKPFRWKCPTCGHHAVIDGRTADFQRTDLICNTDQDSEGIIVFSNLIRCPNVECGAQQFSVRVRRGSRHQTMTKLLGTANPVGIGDFTFLPTTAAPLSAHVPKGVSEDYNEAYLISGLSPKASATLARRALQGMVRDFFSLAGYKTLHAELIAIKDKCDSDLHDAMMAVKSIGNIGAHPEQDVSLIVDVEEGEPETLLNLIHLLDQEWYVARAERLDRIAKVTALAASKKAGVPVIPAAVPAAPSVGAAAILGNPDWKPPSSISQT